MSESEPKWQPGKATEMSRKNAEHPLQPGERWPVRPDVRLRTDIPSVEARRTTGADLLEQLAQGETPVIALRDGAAEIKAVVVPVERYLEMASATVEGDDHFEATLEGHVAPRASSLADLQIEQVDPSIAWEYGSRRWPSSS